MIPIYISVGKNNEMNITKAYLSRIEKIIMATAM